MAFRRKGYKKKSGKSLKKRVAKLEQNLNSEEKKYDDTSGNVSFTSSGATVALGTVPQGINVSERIGNKIKYTGMQVRFHAYANAFSTAETLRFIVFKDNQDDGTVPLITDLLENNTVISPYKQINKGRFQIFYDRTHSMKEVPVATNVVFYKKMNSICKYSGVADTDVIKGGIYFAYIGTQSTHFGVLNYHIRVWYTDL